MTKRRDDIGPAVVARLEDRAKHIPITLSQLCARCGISRSVPHSWKQGTTPGMENYLALMDELDELDRDKLERVKREMGVE